MRAARATKLVLSGCHFTSHTRASAPVALRWSDIELQTGRLGATAVRPRACATESVDARERMSSDQSQSSAVTHHPGRIAAALVVATDAMLARLRLVVEAPPILLAVLRVAGRAERRDKDRGCAKSG